MAELPAARKPQEKRPRRRARESGGKRSNRFLVSYNRDELAILSEAAEQDGTALAAWVADAALAVAKGALVPVSLDSKEVLREQVDARRQAVRVGHSLREMQRVLGIGESTSVADWVASDLRVTAAQTQAVLALVEKTVKRLDAATLQVMRERRPRL